MTLTVADIGCWDAGDVREVFHAASSRAQAAHDAANGIATLPALATWGGAAAAAAKQAIGKTRRDLDAHGREALVVATAARSAAEEIERIKSELATVKGDAAALGLEIDPVSGRVVVGAGSNGTAAELLLEQQQLQSRVDKLVVQANLVDRSLANAIRMADGTTPISNAPNVPTPPLAVPVPTVPAGTAADAAPKTWKDMVLPSEGAGTAPAEPASTTPAPTLQDALFPPGTGADPTGTPKTLDEVLFPSGSPQPAATPSVLDRLNPQPGASVSERRYSRSPLSAPIVEADPSVVEQQLARVNDARANLDAAQAQLSTTAAGAYTVGAGSGPGREVTDGLSRSVFDARRELTEQTAILGDLNQAQNETGGTPVGIPILPENVAVQSFPAPPSIAGQAAAGLAASSHDISHATFGLVPDVAKDIGVFTHWGQHSGADQAGAVVDVASSLPVPGGKFLGAAISHGLEDVAGRAAVDGISAAGTHTNTLDDLAGTLDDLAGGAAHAHAPGEHAPSGTGDHPGPHADAGHVAHFGIEDTAALLTHSEANGGHLIERHVGQTPADLADRLEANPGFRAVSTFVSSDEAAAAVSTVLQHNQATIDTWAASGTMRVLGLEAPFNGGSVLFKGAAEPVAGTEALVVLVPDGGGAWHVLTGYMK